MAKTTTTRKPEDTRGNPPRKISNEITFFRRLDFQMSEEQEKLRDAIYDPDKKIVFCNAMSGSGKTTVSVATACLMIQYGLYDKIIYIFSPVGYDSVGLLPGTLEEKTSCFLEPVIEAVVQCGYQPEKAIKQLSLVGEKESEAFIDCQPHTFMRGVNFSKAIVIIDEAQNFYIDELKKVLTRVKDDCKVVVIGHSEQCDLLKHPERSGFIKYLDWFKNHEETAICELSQNFRGWVSRMADQLKY